MPQRDDPVLRILHLSNSLNQGGAEHVLARLVTSRAHSADEHHVIITLLAGGAYTDQVRAKGIEVIELGLNGLSKAHAQMTALTASLERFRPDVLLTWLYQACLVGTLAHATIPNSRLIWNLRGTAKDPAEASLNNRLSVRSLALLSPRPWAIAVNSRQGRLDHSGLGFRPRRWAYVPNGFDPTGWYPDESERHHMRRALGIGADAIVFAMVARADPQKDHQTLLDAFNRVAVHQCNARLLLAGRGTEDLPLTDEIRRRVIALGSRSDVDRLLRGCDIGVLSSAYGEGLPNAVAEKMLTGLPCVVTDSGDSRLLVGDTGIVVPPRDPSALAEAMAAMLESSAQERRGLGLRARERVEKRYSMAKMHAGYTRLWSDLDQATSQP